MTTTARVAATTAASTAYTFSVAVDTTATFAASDLSERETILFEKRDSAGAYEATSAIDPGGNVRQLALTYDIPILTIKGPIDLRINKPVTVNAVEIVEYT